MLQFQKRFDETRNGSICRDEAAGTIIVELYNEIFDYVELSLHVNDLKIEYFEMLEDFASLTIRLKSEKSSLGYPYYGFLI